MPCISRRRSRDVETCYTKLATRFLSRSICHRDALDIVAAMMSNHSVNFIRRSFLELECRNR